MGPKKKKSSPSPPPPLPEPACCEISFGRDNKKKTKTKGHRQKGAGSVVVDKGPHEKGGVIVEAWQRLPHELLNQYSDRQKRARPQYRQPGRDGKGNFRIEVVLRDEKNSARDLRFCPKEYSTSVDTAKQHAALLALLSLQSNIPLERKLPEPYKTIWLQSITVAKAAASPLGDSKKQKVAGRGHQKFNNDSSTTKCTTTSIVSERTTGTLQSEGSLGESMWKGAPDPCSSESLHIQSPPSSYGVHHSPMVLTSRNKFVSQHDKEQHLKARKEKAAATKRERINRKSKRERQMATVMMSVRMREQIVQALTLCDRISDSDNTQPEISMKALLPRELAAVKQVKRVGFTEEQALQVAAVHHGHIKDKLELEQEEKNVMASVEELSRSWIDWLCIHLPESQLPERLDPTGKMLDVIVPTSEQLRRNTTPPPPCNADKAVLHMAEYALWTVDEILEILGPGYSVGSSSDEPLASAIGPLLRQLLPHLKCVELEGEEAAWDSSTDERAASLATHELDDDLMALEAIFDGDVSVDRSAHSSGYTFVVVDVSGSPNIPGASVIDLWYMEDISVPSSGLTHVFALLRNEELFNRGLLSRIQSVLQHTLLKWSGTGVSLGYEAIALVKGGLPPNLFSSPPSSSIHEKCILSPHSSLPSDAAYIQRENVNIGLPARRPTFPGKDGGLVGHGQVGTKHLKHRHRSAGSHRIESARQELPAAAVREEFLQKIRENQILLVSGETGCGKSTQLPQFLLESWEDRGCVGNFAAVVAQPRRIAAIGVANRVAEEREEPIGERVGYRVRGQNNVGKFARLVFCTTGVLLRRLLSDVNLSELTHLIIDEVHERHMEADFLLALLRSSILRCRPDLKLILMSATLDEGRFQNYLSGPGMTLAIPVLHIPGRLFPVSRHFLDTSFIGSCSNHKTPVGEVDWDEEEEEYKRVEAICHTGTEKRGGGQYDFTQKHVKRAALGKTKKEDDPECEPVPLESVVDIALRAIGEMKDNGAVLIFLPGELEINRVANGLKMCSSDGSLHVLPLHGSLPPNQQALIFATPPYGKRKVVVSTNVAEASITIPDVTLVIDSVRVKEMVYDNGKRMPRLQETWASRASMTQRAGRAGRVKEGTAIHLIPELCQSQLSEHSTPEMARAPLEGIILQILALNLEPSAVLKYAMDPPEESSVTTAMTDLKCLGAVNDIDQLTPLGWHIAAIPCPARAAKMLIYGALLGCIGPVSTIAAGLSCRTPFKRCEAAGSPCHCRSGGIPALHLNTLGQHCPAAPTPSFNPTLYVSMLDASKKRLATCGGGCSDHTALAVIYKEWKESSRNAVCNTNGLSNIRMLELDTTRSQLVDALVQTGFISNRKEVDDTYSRVNMYAMTWRVVKAAVCAGLYPNVCRVVRPKEKFIALEGIGAVEAIPDAKQHAFYTHLNERIFIHPGSVNFYTKDWSSPWIVYHERIYTSKPYIIDSTEIIPYALLLFGGKIEVDHNVDVIRVDHFIEFKAMARIGTLVNRMRQEFDTLLLRKIEDPMIDIRGSPIVQAAVTMIETSGMA